MIKYQGRLHPELVGINNASTFTGFCSEHDNTIFSKVEKETFLGSQEQCFPVAYRALARELCTKKLWCLAQIFADRLTGVSL